MRHCALALSLLLVAGTAFGQKSNVKIAKSALGEENPNFDEAFAAINAAMQDPTTMDDPETYDIAGKLYKKVYEVEGLKAAGGHAYDTVKLYNSTLEMFKYYQMCDEKAQLPDEKGKIRKNKWREDNRTDMLKYHGQLFNAGAVYYLMAKRDYKNAVYFLGYYLDAAEFPMLKDLNLLTDSAKSVTAFYASYAAYSAEDYPNVIKYGQIALNSPNESDVNTTYEIMTRAYREENDTVNWIGMLQESIKRNPASENNMVQLINYYSEKGQNDEAIKFADQLIESDPTNDYSYFIKGYLFQNLNRTEEATELYKKAIEINPNNEAYYSNLGTCYIAIAQELDANAEYGSDDYKDQQKIIMQNYMWARENFEKVRELAPDKEDLWVAPLYRIYYKLGIRQGEDFQMLEKKMAEREGIAQ